MTESNELERRELEALLMELASGERSAEQVERLQQLLLDQPELQDDYCRLTLLETLLRAEFGVSGHTFPPLLLPLSGKFSTVEIDSALAAESCHELATRLDVSGETSPVRRRHWNIATLAIALAALLAAVYAGTLHFWDAGDGNQVARNSDLPRGGAANQEVPSPAATNLLHRVTHTSAVTAAYSDAFNDSANDPFAGAAGDDAAIAATIFQGAARLRPFNGQAAGGYVAVLPPGAALDLTVYADALGENALAVMELDRRGQPTGQLVSFSNRVGAAAGPQLSDAESSESPLSVLGQVGSWSERNDTAADRYFLLTGLQRVALPADSPDWFVADFAVFLEGPDLLQIGWDDTGWTDQPTGKVTRDKDFNDLNATLRIRQAGAIDAELRELVSYPDHDEARKTMAVDSHEFGYAFTVPPANGVILHVTSSARSPNSFALIERKTGRVWWKRDNKSGQVVHLGTFVIQNRAAVATDFMLVAHHVPLTSDDANEETRWQRSERQLLVDEENCQIVGFEDAGGQAGVDHDWDDIRVNLHWLAD